MTHSVVWFASYTATSWLLHVGRKPENGA